MEESIAQGETIGVTELCVKLNISRKTFWRRVKSIPQLLPALQQTGYRSGNRIFTSAQMKMICDVIGYPPNTEKKTQKK